MQQFSKTSSKKRKIIPIIILVVAIIILIIFVLNKYGKSTNNKIGTKDLNLEIDSKYNITFEVVDETVRIEYYIKSFN